MLRTGLLALVFLMVRCAHAEAETLVSFEQTPLHSFSAHEREAIGRIAIVSVAEARRHLPGLPADIVVTIRAGKSVIPETGEVGEAVEARRVRWTVDPTRPGGVVPIA